MRHDPNSGMFSAYLKQRVRFDIQSAVMERPSVDGLTRAFTHISIWRDLRTPKNIPKHIRDAIPPDQNILDLERERKALYLKIKAEYGSTGGARGTRIGEDYEKLINTVKNKKKKRKGGLKKAYRRQYFYRIYNEILGTILNKIETDEYIPPVIQHQLPERTQLQEVIYDFRKDLSPQEIV